MHKLFSNPFSEEESVEDSTLIRMVECMLEDYNPFNSGSEESLEILGEVYKTILELSYQLNEIAEENNKSLLRTAESRKRIEQIKKEMGIYEIPIENKNITYH